MKSKFKTLSRTSQVAIIIAILLCVGLTAYAAISSLLTKSVTTNLTKGEIMEMDLSQPVVTGTVVPGESVAISPSITNTGTKDCLAFVRVSMPTYGAGSPAYSFSVNDGWTKVEENSGTVVYGYDSVLESDEETGPLCSSMTMVNMSSTDFRGLDDVNVTVTGYLADCDEYGTEIVSAWEQIGE